MGAGKKSNSKGIMLQYSSCKNASNRRTNNSRNTGKLKGECNGKSMGAI
jgi:hypothetical protein